MLTQSEKKQLNENGFLLLESLIPPDTTDQLRESALSLAAAEQKAGKSHTYLANDSAQRVWNLIDKGEIFEEAIQTTKDARSNGVSTRSRLHLELIYSKCALSRRARCRTPHRLPVICITHTAPEFSHGC